MNRFLQSIAPDRLVDLSIGGNTCHPSNYRVFKHILSHISDLLAIQMQTAQENADNDAFNDRPAVAFPYAKTDMWKLLLFWAHKKRLRTSGECDEDILILIDAWFLGSELAVPAFQDAIVLVLLERHNDVDTEVFTHAHDRLQPGTPMARFIAEEVVYTIRKEGFDERSVKGFEVWVAAL